MPWIFTRYSDSKIKPTCCHSHYAGVRDAYIFEAYGATVSHKESLVNFTLDFGGMVRMNDPYLIMHLGSRTFSCPKHQLSSVVRCLENSRPVQHGNATFYRFQRWPGVICYISRTDRHRILDYIRPLIDSDYENEHSMAMFQKLVECNVRGKGPEEEARVREVLRGPHPNN